MSIIKNSISIGLWTMISRIFGYMRDVVIAYFLGAGLLNDIFIIALRIPNIFRSIFGEGALNAALVPIFSRINKAENEKEFLKFFISIQTYLFLALIILTVLAEVFMPQIISVMASGYRDNPEALNTIVSLSRLTFPYIVFISLMAFYGGVSNSLGNFFYFASAPIILNIVLIIAALMPGANADKLWYLGYGMLVAGFLEMVWVYMFLYKRFGFVFGISFAADSHVKKAFSTFLPGVFSASASQISIIVATLIASFTDGGISYLYYADRVYQLPLALIATALGTSLLPVLSRRSQSHDMHKFRALQNKSLMFVNLLTIPASLLIFTYSYDIISFLFAHGNFSKQAVEGTSIPLKIFALCLPFFAVNRVLVSCFQALSDTKTPFKITVIGIVISIAAAFLLMPLFEYVAVTIGAFLSATSSTAMLIFALIKKNRFILYKRTLRQLLKILIISFGCILISSALSLFIESEYIFIPECLIFALLYLIICRFTKAIVNDI